MQRINQHDHIHKEAPLPSWQSNLITQIVSAMEGYYCHPAVFENQKANIIDLLKATFKSVNSDLKSKGEFTESTPSSSEKYQVYLRKLNSILENFDSHMHLDYQPEFISEVKEKHQLVFISKERSPKFDLGEDLPDKDLFDWNKAQLDPRNNYGFVSNPNICSLYSDDDTPIGKKFFHTPAYILSSDGLYFVDRSDKEVSIDNLIVSNKTELSVSKNAAEMKEDKKELQNFLTDQLRNKFQGAKEDDDIPNDGNAPKF